MEPEIHRILKLRAAENATSISEIVSDAVKESLREDIEDLEAIRKRKSEPDIPYEKVLKDLKKRGLI